MGATLAVVAGAVAAWFCGIAAPSLDDALAAALVRARVVAATRVLEAHAWSYEEHERLATALTDLAARGRSSGAASPTRAAVAAALDAFSHGRDAGVVAALERAASHDEARGDELSAARWWRHRAFLQQATDPEQAARDARRAVALDPGDAGGHVLLVRCSAGPGNGRECVDGLRRAIAAAREAADDLLLVRCLSLFADFWPIELWGDTAFADERDAAAREALDLLAGRTGTDAELLAVARLREDLLATVADAAAEVRQALGRIDADVARIAARSGEDGDPVRRLAVEAWLRTRRERIRWGHERIPRSEPTGFRQRSMLAARVAADLLTVARNDPLGLAVWAQIQDQLGDVLASDLSTEARLDAARERVAGTAVLQDVLGASTAVAKRRAAALCDLADGWFDAREDAEALVTLRAAADVTRGAVARARSRGARVRFAIVTHWEILMSCERALPSTAGELALEWLDEADDVLSDPSLAGDASGVEGLRVLIRHSREERSTGSLR